MPLLPRVEGTGLGPGHGYRAMTQATWAPWKVGHRTRNMKHRHTSKHVDKWAQIHRPEEHPVSAGHMDTMVVSYRPQGTHGLDGHRGQPWAMDCEGQGKGAFWHDCTGIVRRGRWGQPMRRPQGSVRLPHFVEQLHHLVIDDEPDGHVQAHPAQAGDGALVEPERGG